MNGLIWQSISRASFCFVLVPCILFITSSDGLMKLQRLVEWIGIAVSNGMGTYGGDTRESIEVEFCLLTR